MKKHKQPHTDPNKQVHSEFETTLGNSFKTVRRETPATNKNEADLDDPLNEVPGDEYDLINEWDIAEPPKMNAGRKERFGVAGVIGLLGIVGLIVAIGVVKSVRADRTRVDRLTC